VSLQIDFDKLAALATHNPHNILHDVSKHVTMHQFCWVIKNAWAARRRDEE
jgi:hypothetical protein